jgi:hypothetical protein
MSCIIAHTGSFGSTVMPLAKMSMLGVGAAGVSAFEGYSYPGRFQAPYNRWPMSL